MLSGSQAEIRTIEWIANGHEGAFTLVPSPLDGNPAYGYLYVTQVATRNNMARVLMPVEQEKEFGLLDALREKVNVIIEARTGRSAEAVEL